jgi:hypothetical protein
MVMHIPKDSELSINQVNVFDLIFDKAGNVTHDNKAHLDPARPNIPSRHMRQLVTATNRTTK